MKPNVPWWLRPELFLIGVLAPVFLMACWVASSGMEVFKVPGNYVDGKAVLLGASSIGALVIGSFFGVTTSRDNRRKTNLIDLKRLCRVLRITGIIAIVANIMLLSTLLPHPELVEQFLSGTRGASAQLRDSYGRIPGITSFVQLQMIFFALYPIISFNGKREISGDIRLILYALVFFTTVRTFVASERLALIEMVVPLLMAKLAFELRIKWIKNSGPFIGASLVFLLFAVAEYFRSWQYYKYLYSNYFDFVVTRFFGYFATSVNNGAGIVENFDPFMAPSLTASWFYKFPLWPVLGIDMDKPTMVGLFLTRYGNPEFNNPGGLYVAYADYGIIAGFFTYLAIGVVTGIFYASFRRRNVLGLILYPVWFIGFLDLVRIFYWGDSRFFPVLVFGILSAYYLRPTAPKMKRNWGSDVKRLSPVQ